MENRIFKLLAEKPFSKLTVSEKKEIETFLTEESGHTSFIADLQFLEQNTPAFEQYKSFDGELPESTFDQVDKKERTYKLLVLSTVFIALMVVLIYVFTKNPTSTYQYAFLPDGTEVRLEDNASIKYSENTFSNERTVALNGNAFFDIHHDELHPFKVQFDQYEITVLGTSFYVQQDEKEIWVRDGKVKVSNGDLSIVLTKGEMLSFRNNALKKVESSPSKVALFNKKYENKKVKEVIHDLAAYAGLTVHLNASVSSCKYTGQFRDASLKEALEELVVLFSLEYRIEDQQLYIEDIQCK